LKRIIILLLFVIAIIILLILFRYPQNWTGTTSEPASSNILYNSTANAPSSQETSGIIAMASKTDIYTLKEYEGRIGIFHNDDTVPYQQLDVDVSTFSEEDQRLLKEGITVYSIDELNRKIEDYGS
jgi:hypothetical protein